MIKRLSHILEVDLHYFLGGSFWITIGSLVTALAGLIVTSLFAYLWMPADYGKYLYITSFYGLLTALTLPGINYVVTQAASHNKEGILKNSIGIVFRWSFIGSALLAVSGVYYLVKQQIDIGYCLLISAAIFPISNIGGLYPSFLNGKKQFKIAAIFSSSSLVTQSLFTAFVLLTFPTLVSVTTTSLLSLAAMNFLITRMIVSKVSRQQSDPQLIKYSYHLSLSQIVAIFSDNAERIIIPIFLGFTDNAIYSFAIFVPGQIHNFMKILLTLAQPKVATIDEGRLYLTTLKKAFQLEVLTIALIGGYLVIAPMLFRFFYPQYLNSSLFLSQLFCFTLLYFPSNLFGLGILNKGMRGYIYWVNLSQSLVNLCSIIILLPIYGLIGVIWAKVISRTYQVFIQFYFFSKIYRKPS